MPATLALLLLLCSTAFAQRELRIKQLIETPMPWVTTVVSPFARCAVVSDVAKVLAVGRRYHNPLQPGITPPLGSPGVVSIFRLDDQGQVIAGDPVTLELPKPAALAAKPNYAIGLVAHPTLPLLYVWQDVIWEPDQSAVDPALAVEFDHLLVYSLDENPPKLLFAAARGADFRCGTVGGGLALDKPARRLYVPNMQRLDAMKKIVPAVGWLKMSPDGLPEFEDPAVVPDDKAPPPAPMPPLDPAAASASRATRLATWDQAKAAGKPLGLARHAESAPYTFGIWPCPDSYAPVSDDIVLAASYAGPAAWVLNDQSGRFGMFYLTPYIPYRYRLCAHPTQPLAFISIVSYDGRIIRMEHVDGYYTNTPQMLSIDTLVNYSPPIVVANTNQLIVGGNGRVAVFPLTPEGKFTDKGLQLTVNNTQVEALAWSEKFQRLYVPVEKTP